MGVSQAKLCCGNGGGAHACVFVRARVLGMMSDFGSTITLFITVVQRPLILR